MRLKHKMVLKIIIPIIVAASHIAADETLGDIRNKGQNSTDVYYKGYKVNVGVNYCTENLCLMKCCPFGKSYYPGNKSCSDLTKAFSPDLHDEYMRPQPDNAADRFYFKINQPVCMENEFKFQILPFAKQKGQELRLRTDGKLYVELPDNLPMYMIVSSDKYCIDNFVTLKRDGNSTTDVDALVCFSKEPVPNSYLLSGTCMLISCVFILATVGVYTWLPQLHTIHGRVLVAYLLCLFVGFVFMATMQLLLRYDGFTSSAISKAACLAMSFIIYFLLLSAFFWLNVMCYDMWRAFSGKRQHRLQKPHVWAMLKSYALYAFGIPALLTALVFSLEFSGLPPSPWLPMLRYQGCFLAGKSKLLYLYGPLAILCVANLTLFVLTALRIARTKKETSVLNSRNSVRHDQQNSDKQRLILYLKLFVVMGINWILEVLSAIYDSDFWNYTDAYNVLIGLTIFVIFVCKRKVLQLLKERYETLKYKPRSS